MPSAGTGRQRVLPADLVALFDQAAVLLADSPHGIPGKLITARKVAAEHGTRVVLVGPFSAGKSTLINALLGSELMETNANPSTAIPTVVSHGSRMRITGVTIDGDERPLTLEAYKLASTVGAPTSARIRVAHMQVRAPELADGLELVDLPGMFDQDERDEVTKEFLHNADAVLVVTPAVSGLTLSEREFLTELADLGIRNRLLAVTKLCTVKPASEIPGIRTRAIGLAAAAGIPADRVIMVDAESALTERLNGTANHSDHGMSEFAEALHRLTRETGASKDACAAERLAALVAQAREEATANAHPGDRTAVTSRLIELADLEMRCVAAMASRRDLRIIGQFVRGLQPVALPPPGPERAAVVLRTTLAAVKPARADGVRPEIRRLGALAQRLADADALAPGDIAQLQRALTRAGEAVQEASSGLEADLGKLAQAGGQIRSVTSAVPNDVARQLRHTASNRIDSFREQAGKNARKWAGSPDSALSRISVFSWRDTVIRHVSTVTQRLLGQFTTSYRTFVTTDLRQRLQTQARDLLDGATGRATLDAALDNLDGVLAAMKGHRVLAPTQVRRPARSGPPYRVPVFPVPSLRTDDFPDLARKARDDKIKTSSSLEWGFDFLDRGPQDFLRDYFTPPVLRAFMDWSGKAVHRALDNRVASWADDVTGIVADAAAHHEQELTAEKENMASACAAANADTSAELVRAARMSAEISALLQSFDSG